MPANVLHGLEPNTSGCPLGLLEKRVLLFGRQMSRQQGGHAPNAASDGEEVSSALRALGAGSINLDVSDVIARHLSKFDVYALREAVFSRFPPTRRDSIIGNYATIIGFHKNVSNQSWSSYLASLDRPRRPLQRVQTWLYPPFEMDRTRVDLLAAKASALPCLVRFPNDKNLAMLSMHVALLDQATDPTSTGSQLDITSVFRIASSELRSDRAIVRQAIAQDGWALQYASEDLRDDRDIVRQAIAQNAMALKHASGALRNEPDLVGQAIAKNSEVLQYASETCAATAVWFAWLFYKMATR